MHAAQDGTHSFVHLYMTSSLFLFLYTISLLPALAVGSRAPSVRPTLTRRKCFKLCTFLFTCGELDWRKQNIDRRAESAFISARRRRIKKRAPGIAAFCCCTIPRAALDPNRFLFLFLDQLLWPCSTTLAQCLLWMCIQSAFNPLHIQLYTDIMTSKLRAFVEMERERRWISISTVFHSFARKGRQFDKCRQINENERFYHHHIIFCSRYQIKRSPILFSQTTFLITEHKFLWLILFHCP